MDLVINLVRNYASSEDDDNSIKCNILVILNFQKHSYILCIRNIIFLYTDVKYVSIECERRFTLIRNFLRE
jgi:accessory gene regulator protein AgrB